MRDDFTNDELTRLLFDIQQEIADRHIRKSAQLPQGRYIVGQDIPAGTYDISVTYKGAMWMDIYIYETVSSDRYLEDFTVFADGEYGSGTGYFHVELNEGNLLKCTDTITLTISAGVQFQ